MSIYHKTWQLRHPARWFTCEFLGRIWCSPSPIDQIVTGHAKPGKSLSGWPENLKKIQTHLAFSMCKGTPWAYSIPKVGILILILGLEVSIINNRTKWLKHRLMARLWRITSTIPSAMNQAFWHKMFFQYLSKHSRDLDTFDRALIWLSHNIHSIELKKD